MIIFSNELKVNDKEQGKIQDNSKISSFGKGGKWY